MTAIAAPEINPDLEVEVLTDKTPTKTVACRKCGRGCVVTRFATAAKTECNTCRGQGKAEHKERVQIDKARTMGDPAQVADLRDALINPAFRRSPPCPFNPDHDVSLKCVTHSPNYGPRRLLGYDSRGFPQYDQDVGESVMYQCNDCYTTLSYSTSHPLPLRAQNEARTVKRDPGTPDIWASMLGVREQTD